MPPIGGTYNLKGECMIDIVKQDCEEWLKQNDIVHPEKRRYNLVYIDPPFNTGKTQHRAGEYSFTDDHPDYHQFMTNVFWYLERILTDTGSLFVHLDYREVHWAKLALDQIFGGGEHFINEIIWAYDYGGRAKSKWSCKHDTILFYAKNPKDYTFNFDEMDRIPYAAPSLAGPVKAEKGKTPTDVWWHTIVSPNSKAKTGYPTEKPRGIIDRIIKVHSDKDDWVLDCFAGSGTVGESCMAFDRNCVLVDANQQAIDVMNKRLVQ